MLNCLAQCSNSEHDKRGFMKCMKLRDVWLLWIVRVNSGLVWQRQPHTLSGFNPVCECWYETLAQRGCNDVTGVGGPRWWWGGGGSAWAWKLHGRDSLWQHRLACEDSRPGRQGCSLWSLFAPPSVLHFRALLSARHWIHLERLRSLSTF